MRTPLPDYLTEVLDTCGDDTSGELASYIPELAQADPDRLALSLCTVDGTGYAVGDAAEAAFTIQSISKPFAYALALADHGLEEVSTKVGVEPSGEAFNELSLEEESGRPLNPMINAGAITVHSMLEAERVRRGFAAFAGRELEVDEEVRSSELETADRNRAIAYMLRNHGIVETDPQDVVAGYTEQCSLLVTVSDLATMAATLANGGVQPVTGEQVVPRWVARQVLSVMATCGMYDAAGDWFTTVGIPAKSGVSGGLIGALPGRAGFAVFSPRLDKHGNSVRGVQVFERLSADMGMHLMEVPPPARSLVRERSPLPGGEEEGEVFELQGSVDFVGMERLLRDLADEAPRTSAVVLDLTRVHEVREVGRRMLLEGARRLHLDGHTVSFVDPDGLLAALPEGAGDHAGDEDAHGGADGRESVDDDPLIDVGGGVDAQVHRRR
ncbi:glutaminase [Nocardioides sp. ChNu-153]|uniref:glutaminase n=1 Tax=unclassified Nocardioides TaxID=2615069 RepID=UPI002407083B|nr:MULTISPECIES: glutaminase [unclassified Nocardioides]MDF9716163.1 glutaminase [Nocardioides sp. ChNu-99]MDN7121553.1 glutaminase [Nocardioides sp. ChNu-153]